MPKTLIEAKLTTREARKKLNIGLHWRGVDPEIHLGYRKGKRGGTWIVRWRNLKGYRQRPLGVADDEVQEGTLDYSAAVKAARVKVEEERHSARVELEGPALTVRAAIDAYVRSRDERDTKRKGRPIRSDASIRLGRYVVGVPRRGNRPEVSASPLAAISLFSLDESHLHEWRAKLPRSLKGTTKQRLVNDLKAALNQAYLGNRQRLSNTFEATVKHGLRSIQEDAEDAEYEVARTNQILDDAQVVRLITAAGEIDAEQGWEGDLFRMVVVLASTGTRFSQAARLRVGDLQTLARRLIIPPSRKGSGKKSRPAPVPIGTDVAEALLPAIAGRSREAVLLERWRSKQVPGGIRWQRAGRGPWQTPSELNRAWATVRARAGMPGVIPYALRHSRIVKRLQAGEPVSLVAKLHDTSIAMIERHYGRYIADASEKLAALSIVPLITSPVSADPS